jgi:hypothetical protein
MGIRPASLAFAAVLSLSSAALAGRPDLPGAAAPASPAVTERASLDQIALDPVRYGTRKRELSGHVEIDYAAKSVKLVVVARPVCLPGRLCPRNIEQVIDLELPLVSLTRDSCGGVEIVARQDARPVDGSLLELAVRDDRLNACLGSAEPSYTNVDLVETTAGFNPTGTVEVFTTLASGSRLSAQ